MVRIEESPVARRAPAPWATVQHDCGLPGRVTARFPVHPIAVTDVEHPALVGTDLRVERATLPASQNDRLHDRAHSRRAGGARLADEPLSLGFFHSDINSRA